jgi:hypothetical protein
MMALLHEHGHNDPGMRCHTDVDSDTNMTDTGDTGDESAWQNLHLHLHTNLPQAAPINSFSNLAGIGKEDRNLQELLEENVSAALNVAGDAPDLHLRDRAMAHQPISPEPAPTKKAKATSKKSRVKRVKTSVYRGVHVTSKTGWGAKYDGVRIVIGERGKKTCSSARGAALAYDNHLRERFPENYAKLKNFSDADGSVFENPYGLSAEEISASIQANYPAAIVEEETAALLSTMVRKNQTKRQKQTSQATQKCPRSTPAQDKAAQDLLRSMLQEDVAEQQQNYLHRGPTSGQEGNAPLSMRMMLDQQRQTLARHCPSSTRPPTMAPTTAPALPLSNFHHQLQAVPAVPMVPMLHMPPNFNSFGLPQVPMLYVPAPHPAPHKMHPGWSDAQETEEKAEKKKRVCQHGRSEGTSTTAKTAARATGRDCGTGHCSS